MGRRARHGRRFSGRREVAIGLGVYALYLVAANRKRGQAGRARAVANGARVVALERRLGIHVEPRLQALLLPHRRLLAVLNLAYVTLNVGLTVGWLMPVARASAARDVEPARATASMIRRRCIRRR